MRVTRAAVTGRAKLRVETDRTWWYIDSSLGHRSHLWLRLGSGLEGALQQRGPLFFRRQESAIETGGEAIQGPGRIPKPDRGAARGVSSDSAAPVHTGAWRHWADHKSGLAGATPSPGAPRSPIKTGTRLVALIFQAVASAPTLRTESASKDARAVAVFTWKWWIVLFVSHAKCLALSPLPVAPPAASAAGRL